MQGNWRGQRVAITGGCGYVGRRLAAQLIRQGVDLVLLLDLRSFNSEWFEEGVLERIEYQQCNICDYPRILELLSTYSCKDVIFHLCSFGMSGREQLNMRKIEQINLGGTKNILDACIELQIPSLVYTSTTNVCFAGSPLVNQDESTPYATNFVDAYSQTKCMAEQAIIKANGSKLKASTKTLRTCSIRPAGIYGEGEERHIPRIVDMLYKGLFFFTVGSKDTLVEFIYVDNLVSAHIRAAERIMKIPLSKHQNPELPIEEPEELCDEEAERIKDMVSGQAYFVSDCEPVNNFEFFRPLIEGLGYSYPFIALPTFLMYYIAWMIEVIHRVVSRFINFQPLTRTEISKVSVTHYFKPDKSRDELGYVPFVTMEEGMKRVVDHVKQNNPPPHLRK